MENINVYKLVTDYMKNIIVDTIIYNIINFHTQL